jgi:hypothetical protein
VYGDQLNVRTDIVFKDNVIASNWGGSGNIDHFYHDDSGNEWHFLSDGSYKANGNTTMVAGQYQTTSDPSVKTNVEPATGLLAQAREIQPRFFDWTDDFRDFDDSRQLGLMADEVQNAFPEGVGAGEESNKRLKLAALIGLLTGALGELADDTDRRIAALQDEIDQINSTL